MQRYLFKKIIIQTHGQPLIQTRKLYSNGSPTPPDNDIIALVWLSALFILYNKSREQPPKTPF